VQITISYTRKQKSDKSVKYMPAWGRFPEKL